MDLTSPKIIKELLKNHYAAALKGLGQHFLVDKSALKKIIAAANIGPSDNILEIGPGIGTLTQELGLRAKNVIAIEKDPKMAEILEKTLADFNNVEIIQGDILTLNPKRYAQNHFKLVANLPYYITSPIIRKFLETEQPPETMVLMIQKEVAQRICAKPPDMSLLSVSVQFYAEPEIVVYVPKGSFWPRPKVDSAIIKLRIKNEKLKINKDLFFKFVKAGFSHPRKQLANNLANGLNMPKEKAAEWLAQNNIHQNRRAETLSLQEWKNLVQSAQTI